MSHEDNEQEEYKVYAKDECMKIVASQDAMTAYVLFYPPEEERPAFTVDDIRNNLNKAGIVYGINDTVVEQCVSSPVYEKYIPIANGLPVTQGRNAYIEYKFNTDLRIRPQHNPNGTVNFRKLNNINHVEQGDLLAVLNPEVEGKAGTTVFGKVVTPAKVSKAMLKYGKNIALSEDKLRLYSLVSGHVTLDSNKVCVSNVYEVPYDVDNSTGDIEYSGSILIRGNVRTGFKVRASGDVEVMGIVEDAEIIAGGQVVLHHGIHGRIRGKIVAKGNVVTKFIENVRVFAGGYIDAEAIIQSHVSSNSDITVNGIKGNIIGGHTRCSGRLEAKIIGSDLGIGTVIEVGFDPGLQDAIKALKEQLEEKREEDAKYRQLFQALQVKYEKKTITEQQKNLYKTAFTRIGELQKEIPNLEKELKEKLDSVDNNKNAHIIVRDKVFPGTKFIIVGETTDIRSPNGFCKYFNEDGVIKTAPL